MTWACSAAIAKSPLLLTWEKVKNLQYHSWQLEHWLVHAMMVRAERNSGVQKAYLELAKVAFDALDQFTLIAKSDHKNHERTGAWAYWKECQHKLGEIWWGLRGWRDLMNYEEEFPLLRVYSALASDEFISIVSKSANPYLVNSMLLVAEARGFSPRFTQWEKISIAAPLAFEADGKWNGSVLLPLLLVEAQQQLLQSGRNIPHSDVVDSDIKKTKKEIADVVEAVVTTLSKRQDAMPLFSRWSTWLMRQLLSHSEKEISDVWSAAFIYDALIEAIGSKLTDKSVLQVCSDDAPVWEAWCYRCVLASHAHSNYIEPPESANFLTEWTISPDEWTGEKGQNLRARASLIVTMSKEMPGMAAQLLAYPIVRSESPTNAWIALWNATHSLREIVEFGDADAAADNEYDSRSEAGKLLLLVFRIGLAILDQRVAQCTSNDSAEVRSQAKLYEVLATSVREMREIDDTLNRAEWITGIRHLAIRRLIWEAPAPGSQESEQFAVFSPEDTPTFSDYLKGAKNDAIELLAILQSVLLNNPDIPRLQKELQLASVNLLNVLDMMKRLNQYSSRRYPINETDLQEIERLNVTQTPVN